MTDPSHMRAALALARRGLGTTWPHPSVGGGVVQRGRVVGRGRTASGGRPHAETEALAMAGAAAQGADVYVTLEPCNHTGQTPPCTEALIAAGVARVIVAGSDPDPRVNGSGISRLRAAGIEVVTGVLTAEADALGAGFLLSIRAGRPLVTLKLASTLDGRIATRSGESQWITGPAAREAGHALRGENDAVMVGVGTAAADNPMLTCRIAGFRTRPIVRVVVDSHLRTGLTARLVATAGSDPTWIIHRSGADPARAEAFTTAGVRLFDVAGGERGVDLLAGLRALAQAGITRVLVEGGAKLAAGLLRDGLVDRIAWFHAPTIMGGDGWPAAQAFGVTDLADMARFTRVAQRAIGEDMLSEYQRDAA